MVSPTFSSVHADFKGLYEVVFGPWPLLPGGNGDVTPEKRKRKHISLYLYNPPGNISAKMHAYNRQRSHCFTATTQTTDMRATGTRESSQSPFTMPDLPLPTPPPMANLVMTSRFDLQTRGGYNYRRILNSASTEFGRSPVLGRSSTFKASESYRQFPTKQFGSVSEHLGRSPILRHKNYEDLSRSIDFERLEQPFSPLSNRKRYDSEVLKPTHSKYLSKDKVLSQELDEVRQLSRELSKKFGDQRNEPVDDSQQTIFFNEHYMSDIDENDEIQEFFYGYSDPKRRNSDEAQKLTFETVTFNTLPSLSSFKYVQPSSVSSSSSVRNREAFKESLSSLKSSDCGAFSPLMDSPLEYLHSPKILKTPYRPVVKLAKIRMSRSNTSCNQSSCKYVKENRWLEDNEKSCTYGCDHKELKKCAWTFGNVISAGTSAGTSSYPYPDANMKNPSKPLGSISKVDMNSSMKTLCPRNNSAPKAISEPNIGKETKGQASLPRSFASSKFENNSIMKNEAILCDNSDSRNIDDLLNYILGNKNVDKVVLAQKKSAKKARQRQKREEERLRLEEEEKRKVEEQAREETRREEERLKAEALMERAARKNKKSQNEAKQQQEDEKSMKKNKKQKAKPEKREVLFEETIPAMVTIKRLIENNNCAPTVTITLKGSTPDQVKLLYTLVNGYNNNNEQATTKHDSTQESTKNKKKNQAQTQQSITTKITKPVLNVAAKNKKNKNSLKAEETIKEVAVDKPTAKQTKTNDNKTEKKRNQPAATNNKQKQKTEKSKPVDNNKKEEKAVALNIPTLRLPPGITLTKIDGPIKNRNMVAPPPNQSINNTHTASHHHQHQNLRVPMGKSGVIVVDTEKPFQQSATIISDKKRKKKKNKKENAQQQQKQEQNVCNGAPSMITLKNPVFHKLQATNKVTEKLLPEIPVMPCNQQALVIKNDNGMVTIRSPKLQQFLNDGTPITNVPTDLKQVIDLGPEVATYHTSLSENSRISTLNTQKILSGLPEIEITKVDKKHTKTQNNAKKSCQTADVSLIISTGK